MRFNQPSNNDRRILALLIDRGPLTNREIGVHTDRGPEYVSKNVRSLLAGGCLTVGIGHDPRGANVRAFSCSEVGRALLVKYPERPKKAKTTANGAPRRQKAVVCNGEGIGKLRWPFDEKVNACT